MKDSIQNWWNNQSPDQKRKISVALVVLGVILTSTLGYVLTHGDKEKKPALREADKKEVILDKGIVEDSLYSKATKGMESTKKELGQTADKVDQLAKRVEAMEAFVKGNPGAIPGLAPEGGTGASNPLAGVSGVGAIPPPPVVIPKATSKSNVKTIGDFIAPPPVSTESSRDSVMGDYRPQPAILGNISMGSNANFDKENDKGEADGAKKNAEVYLPPSFMRASLLSGVDAPAMGDGKKDPLPILIRVKSAAFLPNSIRANLRGCYLLGECTGNLADERVHVRLTNLSCLSKDGQAVIDQKVTGFVIDESGRVGMRGEVISKMGASIARSALAGLFGGIGEAMNQSAFTLNTTATGQIEQVLTDTDIKTMAKAGVGKGISTAAKDIQDWYLQLAKQTVPVISIGNSKPVTAVIKEGVTLSIMNKSMDVDGGLEGSLNPKSQKQKGSKSAATQLSKNEAPDATAEEGE